MAKKEVPDEALAFSSPPPGVPVSRFISENCLEKNADSKTIEETIAMIEGSCVSKGYSVKYETVNIATLSFEANQVLDFFIDLEKTPTYLAFDKFFLILNFSFK